MCHFNDKLKTRKQGTPLLLEEAASALTLRRAENQNWVHSCYFLSWLRNKNRRNILLLYKLLCVFNSIPDTRKRKETRITSILPSKYYISIHLHFMDLLILLNSCLPSENMEITRSMFSLDFWLFATFLAFVCLVSWLVDWLVVAAVLGC